MTSQDSIGGLSVKAHRSEAELEELRPFWTREQHHPNSSYDHFRLICRLRPEVIAPCVISVWRGGTCQGLLAGRIEDSTIQPRIGYLKLPRIRGRILSITHEGAIGTIGAEEARGILAELGRLLAERGVDMVVFGVVPENGALFGALRESARRALGVARPRWASHWELTLQAKPGFLVEAMRSKHRSWIRRKERDLESLSPGRVVWKWHARIDDVGPLCRQMEQVAAHTYQRGLGVGFQDDLEHRERLGLYAGRGELRIMTLEIDRRPAAYWLGTVMGQTFHSEATGYLAELREHEVGTQIFLRLVDELVAEGIRRFDFGLGDAAYKQRFGDRCSRETSVRLFGANARGWTLRAYLGCCEVLDRVLRAAVDRLGVADRIKQAWRRRLSKRASRTPSAKTQVGAASD